MFSRLTILSKFQLLNRPLNFINVHHVTAVLAEQSHAIGCISRLHTHFPASFAVTYPPIILSGYSFRWNNNSNGVSEFLLLSFRQSTEVLRIPVRKMSLN